MKTNHCTALPVVEILVVFSRCFYFNMNDTNTGHVLPLSVSDDIIRESRGVH